MKKTMEKRQMLRCVGAGMMAAVLLLSGCSQGTKPNAAKDGETSLVSQGETAGQVGETAGNKSITMAIKSGGDTFNPLAADTNGDDYFQILIWDRLFITKVDGSVEGHLADKWEMTDESTMKVHINEKANWTDGKPVTSADFIWTAQAMTSKDVAPPRSFIMKYLAGTDSSGLETSEKSVGIEAIDEKTVSLHFKTPIDPDMFIKMFNLNFLTLPSHYFEGVEFKDINTSDFWKNPIGNGPCIYKAMVQDERVEFMANKDYYMGPLDFDQFILRIVPPENMLAGLISGEIDLIAGGSNNLPVADWQLANQQKNLVCESAVGPGYYNLCINQQRDYLTPEVGRAFEMAINKQAIVDAMFGGAAEVANSWIPKTSKYYNPATEMMNQYNPEEAKKLLEESGWDFNRELHLLGLTGADRIPVIEMIQQDLEAVGVKVKLETADSATCVSKLSGGEVDMGMMGTAGTLDPDNCAINFTVDGPFCFADISDKSWNDLVDEAAAGTTLEARKTVYDKLAVRVKEEVPYIYLYFTPEYVAYNKKLTNIDITDFFQLQYSVWDWKVAE